MGELSCVYPPRKIEIYLVKIFILFFGIFLREITQIRNYFKMSAKGGANLPLARVKTIMKSSPEVENVNQESLFLVTRATEFFIMYLSKLGQRNGDDHDSVTYADLAAVVQRKQSMEFLHDIVRQKIKYSEYLKMMEEDKSEDDLF